MGLPSLRWRGFGFLRRSRSRIMLPSTASPVSPARTAHGLHLCQSLVSKRRLAAVCVSCGHALAQGLKGQPRRGMRQWLHDLRRWLAAAAVAALLLALLLLRHVWQCQVPQVLLRHPPH